MTGEILSERLKIEFNEKEIREMNSLSSKCLVGIKASYLIVPFSFNPEEVQIDRILKKNLNDIKIVRFIDLYSISYKPFGALRTVKLHSASMDLIF